MQVLPAFVFFGGLAGQPGPDGGPVWLRAVVPAIAVAVAMVVRDAYYWPRFPSSRHVALDAGLAVASAFASQGVLAMAWPELTLTPREALMGAIGTFLAVFSLRAAAPRSEAKNHKHARQNFPTVSLANPPFELLRVTKEVIH